MSSGTNKERLTQNNAKLEELIELVKTKGSGGGAGSGIVAKIQTADISGYTIHLYNNANTLIESKPAGQLCEFNIANFGTYTIKSISDSDNSEFWSNSITIDKLGVYNVKSGRSIRNYSMAQIHEASQGGYVQYMFSTGDRKVLNGGKISFTNFDFMIIDFIEREDGTTAIRWWAIGAGSTALNITFNNAIRYIANAEATSYSSLTTNYGGYKHSFGIKSLLEEGDEIYSQASGIIPDGFTGVTEGTELSKLKYTDTREQAYLYMLDAPNDTMIKQDGYIYAAQNAVPFIKGYFISAGSSLTETEFNSGYYYTKNSSGYEIYTPATEFVSGTTYYGLYEFMQTNGGKLNYYIKNIKNYVIKNTIKCGSGGTGEQSLLQVNSLVYLPCVEELTDMNDDMPGWANIIQDGGQNTSMKTNNIAGEGTWYPAINKWRMFTGTIGKVFLRSTRKGYETVYMFGGSSINYLGAISPSTVTTNSTGIMPMLTTC